MIMYNILPWETLQGAIQTNLKNGFNELKTKGIIDGVKPDVKDVPPKNKKPPYVFVEISGNRTENPKDLSKEIYTAYIHCIAENPGSKIPLYDLIYYSRLAMTNKLDTLPECFKVINQKFSSILPVSTKDEEGLWHYILVYDFIIQSPQNPI